MLESFVEKHYGPDYKSEPPKRLDQNVCKHCNIGTGMNQMRENVSVQATSLNHPGKLLVGNGLPFGRAAHTYYLC